MKETLNVNIGSAAFTIDKDACELLRSYLDDIESRLDDKETLADVESRIADIFMERISSPMQVVSIDMVRRAMSIIGRAEVFGERRYDNYSAAHGETGWLPNRRFYRSRNNRVLAGICGGTADYFGVDTALVRIIAFLLVFFGGLSLWIYIILWIIIPENDTLPGYGRDKYYKNM